MMHNSLLLSILISLASLSAVHYVSTYPTSVQLDNNGTTDEKSSHISDTNVQQNVTLKSTGDLSTSKITTTLVAGVSFNQNSTAHNKLTGFLTDLRSNAENFNMFNVLKPGKSKTGSKTKDSNQDSMADKSQGSGMGGKGHKRPVYPVTGGASEESDRVALPCPSLFSSLCPPIPIRPIC